MSHYYYTYFSALRVSLCLTYLHFILLRYYLVLYAPLDIDVLTKLPSLYHVVPENTHWVELTYRVMCATQEVSASINLVHHNPV